MCKIFLKECVNMITHMLLFELRNFMIVRTSNSYKQTKDFFFFAHRQHSMFTCCARKSNSIWGPSVGASNRENLLHQQSISVVMLNITILDKCFISSTIKRYKWKVSSIILNIIFIDYYYQDISG